MSYESERNKEIRRREREKALREKENSINYAKQVTDAFQQDRNLIIKLLQFTENNNNRFSWEALKNNKEFEEGKPQYPKLKVIAKEPDKNNYKMEDSFLYSIFPALKRKKEKELNDKYLKDMNNVNESNKKISNHNAVLLKNYEDEIKLWRARRDNYYNKRNKINSEVEQLQKEYKLRNKHGVEFYFNKVIQNKKYSNSKYYKKEFELEYNSSNNILVIDYKLPKKSDIPNIKELKYVISKKEFKKTYLKETDIDKIYDTSIYQLALSINYEVYSNDIDNYVDGVIFNGWLTDINRSNGNVETKCLLSLQTNKEKFKLINIKQIDAGLCFKKLKGISGVKLSDLTPVAPIETISHTDKRFVESRNIGNKIEGYNLALMDWEDFEHLIREVFEKEFGKEGADIKITQASRDGGVDAIMFDPDPIKGGKFVIQAKRYTNVVSVSAVRDLYGTVLNEGACKGILVTTSDYGSDSYEFIKDKPLTLINGNNLLYLLQKNGYKARIDLNEAKKIMNDNNKK